MPITIKQRKPNGYVVLRVNSPSANVDGVTLNGATNGANATADEVVQRMAISEVLWSGDGNWEVSRGANVVLEFSGSGHQDYQGHGILVEDGEAQLTSNVNVTATGTGHMIIKLHKVSGE